MSIPKKAMKLVRVLIIWIVLLSIAYSALSIIRHNHFQSGGFDLGLYDQAVWQYAHFQWPYNTIKDRFILGDHLTLTLPLLAPLFWFWDNVRILLIFQAFWISFSALAIYKIARIRFGDKKLDPRVKPEDDKGGSIAALCLAVIYSLFYGIQYLVFFDFHPVVIGVGLLAWIAYFLESGKNRWLVAFVALLLLTQENMGIALASLGFIYFFHKQFRRVAIAFIIGGVAFSLLASKIVAVFSPVGFQYWPQISPNPVIILQQFFDSEEKRQVWWYSLAGFSFLPLLAPGALLAVTFDLAQYFVTGPEFSRMWSPFMHHRATLGVFLTLGTLDAIVLLRAFGEKVHTRYAQSKPGFEIYIGIFLVGVTLFLQYYWHLPLNKLTKVAYWKEEAWMADNRKLFSLVPAGAAVATQQNFVPHLSHRNKIYLVWPRVHDFTEKPCGQISCWWLDFDKRVQYLVVDTRPDQWLTQILESNKNWNEAIGNMEKMGVITVAQSVGAARLYKVQ